MVELRDYEPRHIDIICGEFVKIHGKYDILRELYLNGSMGSSMYESTLKEIVEIRKVIRECEKILGMTDDDNFLYENGFPKASKAKIAAIGKYVASKYGLSDNPSIIPMDHLATHPVARIPHIAACIHFMRLAYDDSFYGNALDDELCGDIEADIPFILENADGNENKLYALLDGIRAEASRYDSGVKRTPDIANELTRRFLVQMERNVKAGSCSEEVFASSLFTSIFLEEVLEEQLLLGSTFDKLDGYLNFRLSNMEEDEVLTEYIDQICLGKIGKLTEGVGKGSCIPGSQTHSITSAYLSALVSLVSPEKMDVVIEHYSKVLERGMASSNILLRDGYNAGMALSGNFDRPPTMIKGFEN